MKQGPVIRRLRRSRFALTLTALPILTILMGMSTLVPVSAQEGIVDRDEDANVIADDSEPTHPQDPDGPRWHFRTDDMGNVSDTEAAEIYGILRDQMWEGYAASRLEAAQAYQNWERYNSVPFRSVTHGQRYVNNYANNTARNYGLYEEAGPMPEGAIIAKDSFTVLQDGSVTPGALFLMEKMPSGFNRTSGDWRYTMLLPDGSLYGTTNGIHTERVDFCISCHLAAEEQDHLHFLPEQYRIR